MLQDLIELSMDPFLPIEPPTIGSHIAMRMISSQRYLSMSVSRTAKSPQKAGKSCGLARFDAAEFNRVGAECNADAAFRL